MAFCNTRSDLLEEEEVYPESRIAQQRWKKNVKEQLVGVYAQPPADSVAQTAQIKWEHQTLQYAPCNTQFTYVYHCFELDKRFSVDPTCHKDHKI